VAYVNKPRPWAKEYQQQKDRGEHEARMRRQKDRRAYDTKETGTMTKTAPSRKNLDLAHSKKYAKGSVKLQEPSKNRAEGGAMSKPKTKAKTKTKKG
jgi:hypothetical protein|tara:strand:- start:714 stop:1004 length:291 start_codon:yes stop_codon:yes gene_type:complete